MNVRDKINNLTEEFESLIANVVDGKATLKQQNETVAILSSIELYANRFLIFGNDEIEETDT